MTTIDTTATAASAAPLAGPAAARAMGTVHIVGAGPVGLFLAALLQGVEGQAVRLYERREAYTRTRMVSLAEYLTAESLDSYRSDPLDLRNVEAIFDPEQLAAGLAYRRTIAADLRELLEGWTVGFVPLNTIEEALSDLITSRGTGPGLGTVERVAMTVEAEQALKELGPDDVLVDCTGARSLVRDLLAPGIDDVTEPGRNTQRMRMEYAVVVTFLYDQNYECNEYCKYYKNVDNPAHKFIPAVRRTHYDGSITHVTGIVNISEEQFEAMPPTCDGALLRERFPEVARSMDRFIDKIKAESHGEIIGDLEVVRIPLDLYRARHATSQAWHRSGLDHPLAESPVFLLGDSALGSPYFQSISLGLESAFVLARHLINRDQSMDEVFTRYEAFVYQQWMRVYMRTQMIKHNKDLLECVGDDFALLERMHVY